MGCVNPSEPTIPDRFANRPAMLAAMQRAVAAARWKHALVGQRVCVWNEGRIEWIETNADGPAPDEIWYDV